MSQVMPEEQDVQSDTPDDGQSDLPVALRMARYTIHVPLRDNKKREIPHVLGALRRQLTQAGYKGRTVVTGQGDWEDYDTEEMALVMIDAELTPENLNAIKVLSQGVKQIAGQEAVYLTVQEIQTYLI